MAQRRTSPGWIAFVAAALALAGCGGLATPGQDLWPYDYTQSPPTLLERLNSVDGPNGSYHFRTEDGDEATYFIGNRSRGSILVFYESTDGTRQQVTVPPGNVVPVGYPVIRIVEVRTE